METIDILADAELVQELRQALEELERGEVLSTDDVLEGLPHRRRGRR